MFAAGVHELIVPEPVIGELARILTEKLHATQQETDALRSLLDKIDPVIPVAPSDAPGVSGDPADDVILATALEASAEVLVSGDAKHLLPLGEHQGMRIIRPQDFLAEVLG